MIQNKTIFHIDVNSAYLSWEAVDQLQHGSSIDIRTIPAVIGGDISKRHGIVLAKSLPCKPFQIKTGESIYSVTQRCKDLYVAPPRYDLYLRASNAMYDLISEYTDNIQRYSIDEVFVDVSDIENNKSPVELADEIRNRIKNELGFTVCVGISENKLLAKMATELRKLDYTNTLFKKEIEKMWALPISELLMVGRKTAPKIRGLNINTIGDLARFDVKTLKYYLKPHESQMLWEYANGIENTQVINIKETEKGIGNSTTTSFDVDNEEEAFMFLLSLSEMVCTRLRSKQRYTRLVSISYKNSDFSYYSHQKKLSNFTDNTNDVYYCACELFRELWKKEPIRQIGVRVGDLVFNANYQISLFDCENKEKLQNVDKVIDIIRAKYGINSIFRAKFLDSNIKPIQGGVGEDNYILFGSKF